MSSFKIEKQQSEARRNGQVAPAVDAKSGQMINPHNPDFLTKKPWYLAAQQGNNGDDDGGPSLEHQKAHKDDEKAPITLAAADAALKQQRQRHAQQAASGKLYEGQWVEALKRNKPPYRICKILKVYSKNNNNNNMYDLEFEDGTIERKIKSNPHRGGGGAGRPRIRLTKTGNRSATTNSGAVVESYDGKRDQYHGYDQDNHNAKVTAKYEQREAMRRQFRAKEEKEREEKSGNASADDFDDSDVESDHDDDDDDDSDDEFVQRDEDAKVLTTRLARQGGVGGAQMKVTARNLRIREDTAKYLRNLNPNSAYYDPKSRSMRDNPNPQNNNEEEQEFAGDNFARISGDAVNLASTQLFAWDAASKGVSEIHPQANPSQAELLKREFASKSTSLNQAKKQAVLDKYGGAEYLDGSGGLASATKTDDQVKQRERKIRFGVSTATEEYAPDGRLKGSSATAVKKRDNNRPIESKYQEDVFIHGHSTVWGSYFHKGAFSWGYADDHSLLKNSYCTGERGRQANDEQHAMTYGTGQAGSAALAQARGLLKAVPGKNASGGKASAPMINRSKHYGEADQHADIDSKKLKEAMERQNKKSDNNKRKYNSMQEVGMTEEEMEAYRLSKERKSDPMANLASDQVVLEYDSKG